MRKLLLSCLVAGSFLNAQSLLTDNFNSYTVGNVGTNTTGTTAGQGGWLTTLTTTDVGGSNASFQIVTNNATQDKVLKIVGSNGSAGSRYASKSISTQWAARMSGNNIIQVEFDIFTGPTTTSKNATRFYIYDTALTKILSGIAVNQDTKIAQGVCYYDATASPGGVVGNYGFYLGGTATTPADVILPANTWIRVGLAFNKTTGDAYFKSSAFNGSVAGAAAGTDPATIALMAFSGGTGNTVSADHLFDNLTVTAVNAVNLLGTSESEMSNNINLKIYPNPATNYFKIESKENVLSVYAYDLSGKRIDLKIVDGNVDIASLAAGNYLIGIKTKSGFVTKKLIKQ